MARTLENARYLRRGLQDLGYKTVDSGRHGLDTPLVPVVIGDDWKAALIWKALYDAGCYVNVALYPAVELGNALLRTSVMATHEKEHLDRALGMFESVRHVLDD
jgi:8-amino-7-oxononanoate synthase